MMPRHAHPFINAFALLSILTLVTSGLLTPFTLEAQNAATAKAEADTQSMIARIPEVVQDSLPNGVRILFTRLNDLPLAEINVIVDAGISLEGADNHGAAYGVNQLLLSGSSARTGEMVSNYRTKLGSVIIPYVHYDYAQLYAKTLSKHFSGTLEMVADAVVNPTFPEQALLRLKQDASVRLFRQISRGEHATITAVKGLCGDEHVMTRFLQPTAEEVRMLTMEQLKKFHADCYQPRRTTVIITGNLDYRFVKTALTEVFGKWRNGETVKAPTVAPETIDPSVTVIADSATPNGLSYFRIAGRGALRSEKDFAPQMLLNNLLTGGPESRLRQMLWGKHVISPNFTTSVAFSRDCSYFMISGSASPMSADSVLQFVHEVIIDIARNGISNEELAEAKKAVLADETLTFAKNRNVLSLLKEAVVYHLPLKELFAFSSSIRAVTPADIQRVAHRVLQPDHLETVVLGSAEKMLPLLDAIGKQVRLSE